MNVKKHCWSCICIYEGKSVQKCMTVGYKRINMKIIPFMPTCLGPSDFCDWAFLVPECFWYIFNRVYVYTFDIIPTRFTIISPTCYRNIRQLTWLVLTKIKPVLAESVALSRQWAMAGGQNQAKRIDWVRKRCIMYLQIMLCVCVFRRQPYLSNQSSTGYHIWHDDCHSYENALCINCIDLSLPSRSHRP